MEVQLLRSVPKEELLLEHPILYRRIDCSVLLQTLQALGLAEPVETALQTSLQTHKNRFLPRCHVHSAELFSSPEDDDSLLEHFFHEDQERQQ